MITSTT